MIAELVKSLAEATAAEHNATSARQMAHNALIAHRESCMHRWIVNSVEQNLNTARDTRPYTLKLCCEKCHSIKDVECWWSKTYYGHNTDDVIVPFGETIEPKE